MAVLRTALATLLLAAGAGVGGVVAAQPVVALDESLNESIVMVPKKGLVTLELETTLFLPDGPGPFPIAVINHGKSLGDPRFQARYRAPFATRYFLQRGYAVLLPMRQGFSKSRGSYIGADCNVQSNGRVQAEDVKAALDWAVAQPWADRERIVVLGQSHGGWTTLAFGALNYPGVRGLVNFAGGLKNENCISWKLALAGSVAGYARDTRAPSLWFYGDNDSFFPPEVSRSMHEQYQAAGGKAQLVAYGNFRSDAHLMFATSDGAAIWQPVVSRFLASVGLPSQVRPEYEKFGASPPLQ